MATGQKAQVRSGRCLCGAVRYSVRGPLRGIIVCHCGQCRRQHSYLSAFTSAARADVSLEGADGVRWFAASARGRRGFCAACGSSGYGPEANFCQRCGAALPRGEAARGQDG